MASKPKFIHCVGNPSFNPSAYITDTERQSKAIDLLAKDDLYHATILSFSLPERDDYTYHAMTAVRLGQVQHIVSLGGANNLHAWYRAEDGSVLDPPPKADIEAYINIFLPSTLNSSALKGFAANAKKSSIRASVASHLTTKRFLHPSLPPSFTIPRCKKSPPSSNPYFDFWAWSARNLEWCGPSPASRALTSHHVLPILMHHFGCATPSHEALELLRLVAAGRPVVDIGSGNGYWTFMLRRYGLEVRPVDNMQSEWRVNWVDDTEVAEGTKWLARHDGGKDHVMLLVYPVVGGGVAGGVEGGFTRDLVKAFKGDTIAVVGTQNRNGYTGFRDMTMDEFMEKEEKEWTKIVQVPLPSFAGKDEALYIFRRGDAAPS
ncbi:hypothetical protein B0T11DRAFT_283982 [Plectosphaerella cucumerina]|uniref:Uncharacterized protein n=1 Tax=Plectosphaerella cucumerina TaxID=40658 RepID=A0A8K0TGL9_9PEZI|nr:hypothetical protein B0T11DRAFT_283982 [Plectosphaerella cucumerina]